MMGRCKRKEESLSDIDLIIIRKIVYEDCDVWS